MRRYAVFLAVFCGISWGGVLKADEATCPAGSYINADNECELCPVGTYSNTENAASCTKCSKISYNDTPGATSCTKCDAGYYSSDDRTECLLCKPGYYCMVTNALVGGLKICPSDHPESDAGAKSKDECYIDITCPVPTGCATSTCPNCPDDYTCETIEYYDGTIKSDCDESICSKTPISITALPGYYIDGDRCEKCPTGTVSPGGNVGVDACAPCPNGTYLTYGATECTPCPVGYPNSDSGATGATECYSDVRYRPYDGTVTCRTIPDGCTAATCTVCETEPTPCEYAVYAKRSGFGSNVKYVDGAVKEGGCTTNPCISDIVDSASGNSDTKLVYNPESGICEPCGPGTYFDRDFIYGGFVCKSCPAGTYNPNSGAINANACTACPAGTYSAAGAVECTPCDAINEYQPNTGATECIAVPGGSYKIDNATLQKCESGYWCADGVRHACTDLDKLFVESGEGTSSPEDCRTERLDEGIEVIMTPNGAVKRKCLPGTYTQSSQKWCYWDDVAKDREETDWGYKSNSCHCDLCYPGTATNRYGTYSSCGACIAGTYSVGYGNTECLPCPAGTTGVPDSQIGSTECTPCPSGTYAPTAASPYCLLCPPNTFSYVGATECTPCTDSSSDGETCGRMLNIQPNNGGAMTQIFLSPTRFTSPSMNFQIGNRVYYADMTPVDVSNEPGMYAAYNNKIYRVSDGTVLNEISTPKFWVKTQNGTSTFTFTIAASGTFIVDWGDGTTEKRTHDDVEPQTYTHTYETPGQYKIGLGGLATGYAIFDPYNPDFSRATLSFGGLHDYRDNNNLSPITEITGVLSRVFPTIGNGGNGNQPNFAATFSGRSYWNTGNPFEGLHGIPSDGMFMYTFANNYEVYYSNIKNMFLGLNYTAPYLFAYTFYGNKELYVHYLDGIFSSISGPIRPYMFESTFSCEPEVCNVFVNVPQNFFGNLTGDDAENAFEKMFYRTLVHGTINNLSLPDGRYIWDVWPDSGNQAMSTMLGSDELDKYNVPQSWRPTK